MPIRAVIHRALALAAQPVLRRHLVHKLALGRGQRRLEVQALAVVFTVVFTVVFLALALRGTVIRILRITRVVHNPAVDIPLRPVAVLSPLPANHARRDLRPPRRADTADHAGLRLYSDDHDIGSREREFVL